MRTTVVYASKYGFTEQYARWIAEDLEAGLYEIRAISAEALRQSDAVVFGGGLYAGGVNGLSALLKHFDAIRGKPFVLFTCGVADPQEPGNVRHIRECLHKALPPEAEAAASIFHLRGGLDYKRLTFVHRAMMAMLKRMIVKKAPGDRSEEDRQILATYGKAVNFTDRAAVKPIVSLIQSQNPPQPV